MTTAAESSAALLIKQASHCAKQDRVGDALQLLRDAIRGRQHSPDDLDKAGRLLSKWTSTAPPPDGPQINVMLLGQCTTSWLATALKAVAWGERAYVRVMEGEYDNVIQELMVPHSELQVDVIILVPWSQRLLFDPEKRSAQYRIDEELAFWKQAWSLIAQNHAAKIVQVGYDWITPGPLGHHLSGNDSGEIAVVRRMNLALRANVPSGAYVVDLEQISGGLGRSLFYDQRRYFWTKQPFSERGTVDLAYHLWSGLRAVMYGPKKVLVLDLDNTLWGGVVGETGPLGIAIGETPDGEAFRAFQKHVKGLSKRGVVLALASKNNREDALAPFQQNPEMVLKLEDFAHIEAHWEPKDLSLRRIAETLKLGLDSFVFFDDNPAERELVRQSVPDVAVVDVPVDPADYVRALQAELWFEAAALLEADSQRTAQYQLEQERRELQNQFGSMDDYLQSLDMQAVVCPIDDTNIQRVVQLIGKTNQFNLTTRRHSQEEACRLLGLPGAIGLTLSLSDRFGDHGLVSVLIAVPGSDGHQRALRIDTWLMSCRVIARTAEEFFMNTLVERAQMAGWNSLHGEYIPTKKNMLVADLYDRFGFERLSDETEAVKQYRLILSSTDPAVTFIRDSGSRHE